MQSLSSGLRDYSETMEPVIIEIERAAKDVVSRLRAVDKGLGEGEPAVAPLPNWGWKPESSLSCAVEGEHSLMFKLRKLYKVEYRGPLIDTSLLGVAARVVYEAHAVSGYCEDGAGSCSNLIAFACMDAPDEKQRAELVRRMLFCVSHISAAAQRVGDALRELSKLRSTVAVGTPLVDLIGKLHERRLAKRVNEWEQSYRRKLSASGFEDDQEDSETIKEAWEWGEVVKLAVNNA